MNNRITSLHHTAIICSNYEVSKHFYCKILELEVLNETYRSDRRSFKLDLALNGNYIIELFSFPNPPKRLTRPEAAGLRHLAFSVAHLEPIIQHLAQNGLTIEPIRTDELTGKRFTFTTDPDGLPIEFYEN
jgi:glyoxylase I family protein